DAVREKARAGCYDAVLVELSLTDAQRLEAVRAIRRSPETRALPVLILSSVPRDDGGADPAALDMVDWIDKPVDHERLLQALLRGVDRAPAARPTILHIDDDADMLEVTAAALARQGRVLRATSIAAAKDRLTDEAPDIIVLDLNLPDGNGLDLLPELLRADGTAIPTIIYSAED